MYATGTLTPDGGFGCPRTEMGAPSGGRGASGNSSSQSLDNVAAAASAGEAYKVEVGKDGGRGRGACRRGSGT